MDDRAIEGAWCRVRVRRFGLAVVACAVTGTVFAPAPVSASVARGHVFGTVFGQAGSGPGELDGPSGVAVDEATGEVFVVNAVDERVEMFRPDAGGGYEAVGELRVRSPGAIAVDDSRSVSDPTRGDVFVAAAEEREAAGDERDQVVVYSPAQGKVIHRLSLLKEKGGEEREEELEDVVGLAVDEAGVLWVEWQEEGVIDAFSKEATSGGGVRLEWEPSQRRTPELEERFGCAAVAGFALAPDDGAFYESYERENAGEECPGEYGETPDGDGVAKLGGEAPAPRVLLRELDGRDSSGVAVEAGSGDVFVGEGASVAELTPSGLVVQVFGAGQLEGGAGLAVDAANGEVFVSEPAANRVVVFGPETEARAPAIDGLSARDVSATSAELRGEVDPGGEATEYEFFYGPSGCVSEGSCTSVKGTLAAGFGDRPVSVVVDGLAPATAYSYRLLARNGKGAVQADPSPDVFSTLPAASVLPDGRRWELVTPADKHGAAVETLPAHAQAGLIESSLEGSALTWLANGPVVGEPEGNRSFELTQLISERAPNGGWSTQSLETRHEQGRGLLIPSPSEYHYFTPDLAESLVEPTEPSKQSVGVVEHPPLSPEASEKTMYIRDDPPAAAAAEYEPLVTAANDTAGNAFGGALEFIGSSEDLGHVVFESKVGLTAGASSAGGLYEWQAGEPLQLVSVLPDGVPAEDRLGREPFLGDGGGLDTRGAISQDGSRVFWSEASEEHLYLRDSVTGETILVDAAQGNGASERGVGGQTLPEPSQGEQLVHFQAASVDGSRVFFTDTARLSEESAQQPGGEEAPSDLYEFQLTSGPGEPLRGRLTDLTAGAPTASADVLNLIPGVSRDGEYVYFVANGVLAPGATPGECIRHVQGEAPEPLPGATCNLYVSGPDPEDPGTRQTRFIAALSYKDAADWAAGNTTGNEHPEQNLSGLTAGVSENGRYLAFMSQQSLTGYDNQDALTGEPDEEVYLYDAQTGRLTCVSCNPNTEPDSETSDAFKQPHGVQDTLAASEGIGLLVDRPETWLGHDLAGSLPGWSSNVTAAQPDSVYQPRYLSDDGRLFFDSPDDLLPEASNHEEDVYEYEPENVGSCTYSSGCIGLISSGGGSGQESVFLDASENGNDVFFLTSARLSPEDTDETFDIYDAHVCSETAPCPTTTPSPPGACVSSESCRPFVPAQPAVQTPPSETFTGPGNTPKTEVRSSKTTATPKPRALTRKQLLARALERCRKLRRKHERTACEKQARKRYRAKPKTKKGKRTSTTTHGSRHSTPRPQSSR